MPTVRSVLVAKGNTVHSTSPTASVREAVDRMNQHKIGALVVMAAGEVVGMFTERDVLRRVVGENRSPADTTVDEVMSGEVVCCGPDAQLDEVATIMKNRRIRHLPVCDDKGELRGLISIGDLNAHRASDQEATIYFLNEYIYGRA